MKGAIVNVVKDKGFGFISPEGSTKSRDNIFFHESGIKNGNFVDIGDLVEYDVKVSSRGAEAVNVSLIDAEDTIRHNDAAKDKVGIVSFINAKRIWGRIKTKDFRENLVFFMEDVIKDDDILEVGSKVTFGIGNNRKGFKAVDIIPIS